MPKMDTQQILRDVKANLAKLDHCPGPHVFQPFVIPHRTFPRYRCAICGGEVEGTNKLWYEKGLAHARQVKPHGGAPPY